MIIVDRRRELFINEQKIRNIKNKLYELKYNEDTTLIIDKTDTKGILDIKATRKAQEKDNNNVLNVATFTTTKKLMENLNNMKDPNGNKFVKVKNIKCFDYNHRKFTEEDAENIRKIIEKNEPGEYDDHYDRYLKHNDANKEIKNYLEKQGFEYDEDTIDKIIGTETKSIYGDNRSMEDFLEILQNCNKTYQIDATITRLPEIYAKVVRLDYLLRNHEDYSTGGLAKLYKEIENYFYYVKTKKNKDLKNFDEEVLKYLADYFFKTEEFNPPTPIKRK